MVGSPLVRPSVIAARKFLYVSGRFSFLPPTKGREAERQKAHLTAPRLDSRIAGNQRHTATPFSVPPRRLLRPWGLTSGTGAAEAAIQAGFRPPFACPVQPFKAEPHSGLGRLPKAPRVRRARPPRPQAPHPAPRYKRPGNAPFNRDGIGKNLVQWENMSSGERLNFLGLAGEDSYSRKINLVSPSLSALRVLDARDQSPSLRATRSDPETRVKSCFVAALLAMTRTIIARARPGNPSHFAKLFCSMDTRVKPAYDGGALLPPRRKRILERPFPRRAFLNRDDGAALVGVHKRDVEPGALLQELQVAGAVAVDVGQA